MIRRFAVLGARPERVSLLGQKSIAKLSEARFTLSAWFEGDDEPPLPWGLGWPRPLDDFSKLGAEFIPKAKVAAFAGPEIEFILQLDEAPPPASLLQMPRNGVWRFASSTPGPLAFWDVFDGLYHLEIRLERLTEREGWTIPLDRRWLPVNRCSYSRTVTTAISEMPEMPAYVATVPPSADARPVAFPPAWPDGPSAWDRTRMLLKLACRNAWTQARGILLSETWKIGVVESPLTEFAAQYLLPAIHWLPNPAPNRFLADPFLVETGDGFLLMAEEFDLAANRGRIVQLHSPDTAFTGAPRDAIREDCHMSYPFLLRDGGELYCIPETYQKGGIFAWRRDEAAGSWKGPRQIFGGQTAGKLAPIDPTLVEYDGRWWLFCTDKYDGIDSKLRLYYADSPWGPWTAHARNPVKVDIRSSRPGGAPFVYRGELYRPAQDSSKHYGWRLMVNRVTRLSPTDFAEETVRVFDSDRLGVSGIHTLAGCDQLSVVDGRVDRFLPRRSARVFAHKLRRLFRGRIGE